MQARAWLAVAIRPPTRPIHAGGRTRMGDSMACQKNGEGRKEGAESKKRNPGG
ncbi:MAG: hypothetical protein SOR57_09415 [Parabacteroides sp.]|nr:hypothetical protein [Parabacteroides sp.]